MANNLELLPLFPLHAVLFPFERMQLHIFEPRYREMITHCLDFDAPFGIVQIRQGEEVGGEAEPYLVGTACRIENVHHYPDGRMHITVVGERRFRIRRIDEQKPYLVGHVEAVNDPNDPDNPRCLALSARLEETFRMLIQGMLARPDFNIDVQMPDNPTFRSFVVARFLNLENAVKQRMLELTDSEERLAELIPLIEKQIVESKTRQVHRLRLEHVQDHIHPN